MSIALWDLANALVTGGASNTNPSLVRVRTSSYVTGGKFRTVRDVYTLKRKSKGAYDTLAEELSLVGNNLCIVNLFDVQDGIYEIVTCNHSYDRESGRMDGWDLKLVPYNDQV